MTTGTLSGKPTSYWLDSAPETAYPQLDRDLHVDVAVVGAGMLGITAALLLVRQGARVALIEADRVAHGVTAYTTAKVSSGHGLRYEQLESSIGVDGARAYGQANERAIERIAGWVDELGIVCDWRRKPNFVYSVDPSQREQMTREAAAAVRAGLPATLVTEAPELPFPIVAAVRYDNHAEFHPRKYLLGLVDAAARAGVEVFERSRVVSAGDGEPATVRTAQGHTVTAGDVIVATHYPFMDRGLYFARQHQERSYALGVYVDDHTVEGMYLSTESPAHTLRSIPTAAGEMLLVGGESHRTGQADEVERYARLEGWARQRWQVREVAYRWSTQDAMPVDGVPYVGKIGPGAKSIWTGTGFLKWGLTNGTAAAEILAERIAGRDPEHAGVFDSNRLRSLTAVRGLAKEAAANVLHFVGDRLARPDARSFDDLRPGQGGTVRVGAQKVGAYRDDDGRLHAVHTTCTHMGCSVLWNQAERSWDCPCHGSRFHWDGSVIEPPAVKGLKPYPLE